jgi:hypothetical protein
MFVILITRKMINGTRAFCSPRNQPIKTKLASVPGALQIRIEKYSRANDSTSGSAPISLIAKVPTGCCIAISVSAINRETISACPSDTRKPSLSSAPRLCAVMPVVPMRRKFMPV